MRSTRLATLACAALATLAPAQGGAWKAQVDLGVSLAEGNTQTSDIDLLVNASHEGERLRHTITVNTHRSTATIDGAELTTQDIVDADYALRIQQTERWYATVNVDSYRDIGLDGRLTLTAGAGRDLIDTETATLTIDFGAGGTTERVDAAEAGNVGDAGDAERTVFRWGVTGERMLSDRLTLFGGARALHLDGGGDIYDGEIGLRLSFSERLSAGFRLDVHDENPPLPGREPRDVLMSLTIGASF